jgi:hypothetical protein
MILTGGIVYQEATSTVFLYNEREDSWSSFELTVPRYNISVLTTSSHILFVGGYTQCTNPYRFADVYDAQFHFVSTVALKMTATNIQSIVANEVIYFYSSEDSHLFVLDLASNTTRIIPSKTAMSAHANGTHIFFLNSTSTFASIDILDTTDNTWQTSIEPFTTHPKLNAQYLDSSSIIAGGKLLATLKGLLGESDFGVFDIETRTWISSQMPLTFVPTVASACNNIAMFSDRSVTVQIYASSMNIWTSRTMAEPVLSITQASDKLFVLSEHSMGVYDAARDRWTSLKLHETLSKVYSAPTFSVLLNDSVLLCEHNATITPSVKGYNLTYSWTVDGVQHSTDSWLSLTEEELPCESKHIICLTATNPWGEVQSCGSFEALKMKSIFIKGPVPKDNQIIWLSGAVAVFRVEIAPEQCTRHTWWLDGQQLAVHEGLASNLKLNVTTALQDAHVYVIAECGNSVVKSKPYWIKHTTELNIFGVIMILFGGVIVVGGAIITAILFKRKKIEDEFEEELQSLFLHDKTKEEAEWILQTTKFGWSPTNEISFCPVNKLPFSVHVSNFSAIAEQEEHLNCDYSLRTEVIFAPTKSYSSDGLNEPLISGTKINLHVPPIARGNFTLDNPSIVLHTKPVSVGLSATLSAGSKVCLLVVCEQLRIYSMLEFKLKMNK